ncbi:glycosyltransferase family 2 protein [Branchiibius sp. NY16-3462-2]|uniref:glycosyltransferase family 2 protein n=1 Tax=Branchiibius sp. NY16-3462-2 TaxID=1807500 RepID=UPI0007970716|nr:glycosyltransferase family 2 protein [Branchiibius sp. NY16-3462-2]KYH43060.1 hypothetical protein AZH51_06320 [Branchiibius sp. NY16-3462-2]
MSSDRRGHLIVILSYGDPDRALRCATSCLQAQVADVLIVVNPVTSDSPPADALVEFAGARPHADLLVLPRNLGFTGGMNAGLQWGRQRGYDVLTVLNDDTTVRAGAVPRLDHVARSNAAAIAPRIDFADRPGEPWSLGVTNDATDLLPRHLTHAEFTALPRRDGLVAVPLFTGCCICATAAVWDLVGGFDDDYFLYFEDSDWSQRARQLGVPLLIDDQAIVDHEVSASSDGYLSGYYYARNLLRYATTWHAGAAVPLRMYARRSLRPALRTVRTEGPVEAARRTFVSLAGATAFAGRRRGPVGPRLTRVITALSGSDRRTR